MKVFICACLLVVNVSAYLKEQGVTFQDFKSDYGKTYKNQVEETKRFSIFKDNLRKIEEHNALYAKGLVSYKKGINKFSDLTQEEFTATLTLTRDRKSILNVTSQHVNSGLPVPSSVDWRDDGQVTGVKDQAACGSCWAFSVTGATEAAFKRKTGRLVSLSEQQLIDCTTSLNSGCHGGYTDLTFRYVYSMGLESEADYPYTALNDECKFDASKVVTRVSGHTSIASEDESSLLDAVATVGPISVLMDARYLSDYSSGIYQNDFCDSEDLDHAVLIVGYGSENGQDYWMVKNSWGSTWGDNGYFKIVRGTNECGIAEDSVYPHII